MKLFGRLLSVAEVFLVGSIVYFAYTLFGADSNFQKAMPRTMQLNGTLEPGECMDRVCLNVLSEEEREQYDTCYNKTVAFKVVQKFGSIRSGACHFQNGIARYPVGLGSFQGSGNTWLRGLLEKVTGICTGKVIASGLNAPLAS